MRHSTNPGSGTRNYSIVTLAYWADTLADGAIRTLVLFYFYQLGYSALQVASLFLFYELFGVITNLCGGYLAARFGLKSTLYLGLGVQLLALGMLAWLPATALTVVYVMASQALSGIAKDLTKMSSKSAVKLIAGDSQGRLYRWVALLTGSKNALKGVGFFLGGLLLSSVGFRAAVLIIAALVALALMAAALFIRGDLGQGNPKTKFTQLFSRNQQVNLLAIARMFLFGARDVWFVVAVPVFLSSVLGWKFWQSGGFMALWVIGYGFIQAAAPKLVGNTERQPDGRTATRLAFALALTTATMAGCLFAGTPAGPTLISGLVLFGVVFALNSAVHSYLILAYTDSDRVALNVGLYYMANACGRLGGTLLSGLLYGIGVQQGGVFGLLWCLLASALLVLAAALTSLGLPRHGLGTRAASLSFH